jgi:hypothetical protein
LPQRPADVGFHCCVELLLRCQLGADVPQPGQNVLQQDRDMPPVLCAAKLRGKRSLHRAATFVTEHEEQRCAQVHSGVLQGTHDFGRNHVAGDSYDKQLAETGVEYEFRRHSRIAAAKYRRVRTLRLRELARTRAARLERASPRMKRSFPQRAREHLICRRQPLRGACAGLIC